jgi:4-hydroxybenzoate polyprenyltransferase
VEEGSRQFLPPQPPGPEPELGSRPAPPPPAQPVPAYGWQQPAQPQPDNGPAVAGFVLSIVSVSLLVLSAGLSSLISLGCAILGIVYARKGKRKVESGETTKNAGLAQAGFIVGIVSLCLSALATAFWVAVLVAAVGDEEFRDDIEREFDNSESIRAGLQVAAAIGRLLVT